MPSSVASAAAIAEAMATVSCVGPAEESATAAAEQPAEGSAPQEFGSASQEFDDVWSGCGDCDAWGTAWGGPT